MGDVAMTVPVLKAFAKQYPNIKVTVLTRGFFAPFFEDIPNVTVYIADLKGKHKGVLGLWKLSKVLKTLQIDAIADLHNVLRSKILKTFLFGIKTIQIDKGRAEKKALVLGENFQQLKTTHQRYADVFKNLGFPVNLSNPEFPERGQLSEASKKLLGQDHLQWIGVAPFAAHESKMYPLEMMQQVVKALSKTYKVILFGSQAEAEILESWCDDKNIVNLAGRLLFKEELDVISNLDVMLSMDSGNAHLAAMFGIKTVTIWGVTHPYAGFAPFNQPNDYCLLADRKQYPKIPTSVYGNKFPEGYENAAGSIPVERVVDKIQSVITGSKATT
ncbi:glycosyltransferase family 9 protein [Mangrovimonas spongiae]|uniref:Glycosyltransferase family 9 protein n=1 Tax=Mangrovimonas spongiae TaxID=2494697 RepID=A0A428K520_9FLAO|nr:glycosyltransferase family 9 protein [Mangrovimonas spongiae]RSK41493.1 glycosyltransferase family 9 protein [Mangrovimonas spongiae]